MIIFIELGRQIIVYVIMGLQNENSQKNLKFKACRLSALNAMFGSDVVCQEYVC